MPKKWDITPHVEYIKECTKRGHSIRMIAETLMVNHKTLAKAMKSHGMKVPTREESAKRTWKNHKHPHLGKKGKESYMFGRKLTDSAKRKLLEAISGPNNYRWSGGRKMSSGGYVLVYSPKHPHADKNGFVLEHRLAYEKHIGRVLETSEIVHHVNGDKTDNRIENLRLITASEHAKIHMKQRKEVENRAQ